MFVQDRDHMANLLKSHFLAEAAKPPYFASWGDRLLCEVIVNNKVINYNPIDLKRIIHVSK